MRIIAGDKRGTRLVTLEGEETRPTLERVKEATFSSVQFLLPGAIVLDLYAGSGQMGLEALSRGALRCTFVDDNFEAVAVIKKNCQKTGLYEKSRVVSMDVAAFLAQSKGKFDIVLLDPPYRQDIPTAILPAISGVTAPGGVVLCETELGVQMPQKAGVLTLQKQYKHGTVLVSRYTCETE